MPTEYERRLAAFRHDAQQAEDRRAEEDARLTAALSRPCGGNGISNEDRRRIIEGMRRVQEMYPQAD